MSRPLSPVWNFDHLAARKVKMARDPPTGCSFTSLKQPKINMESFWFRCSKLKSTLHSGWVAVRKVNFAPRIPVNGSFSSRSLAYMHASTRYIKQVSGLLKIGVTSMCNNGSPSYEAVQGTKISAQFRIYDLSKICCFLWAISNIDMCSSKLWWITSWMEKLQRQILNSVFNSDLGIEINSDLGI